MVRDPLWNVCDFGDRWHTSPLSPQLGGGVGDKLFVWRPNMHEKKNSKNYVTMHKEQAKKANNSQAQSLMNRRKIYAAL